MASPPGRPAWARPAVPRQRVSCRAGRGPESFGRDRVERLRQSLLRSAAIVSAMTLISRISGLFQSVFLAYFLGADAAADAFYVAFRLPNLLRRFTAEGTMT